MPDLRAACEQLGGEETGGLVQTLLEMAGFDMVAAKLIGRPDNCKTAICAFSACVLGVTDVLDSTAQLLVAAGQKTILAANVPNVLQTAVASKAKDFIFIKHLNNLSKATETAKESMSKQGVMDDFKTLALEAVTNLWAQQEVMLVAPLKASLTAAVTHFQSSLHQRGEGPFWQVATAAPIIVKEDPFKNFGGATKAYLDNVSALQRSKGYEKIVKNIAMLTSQPAYSLAAALAGGIHDAKVRLAGTVLQMLPSIDTMRTLLESDCATDVQERMLGVCDHMKASSHWHASNHQIFIMCFFPSVNPYFSVVRRIRSVIARQCQSESESVSQSVSLFWGWCRRLPHLQFPQFSPVCHLPF